MTDVEMRLESLDNKMDMIIKLLASIVTFNTVSSDIPQDMKSDVYDVYKEFLNTIK